MHSKSKYAPVLKQIELSKDCKEMVIGTLFGDGHLSKPAKNARLQLTHGDSQKFYIEHKAEYLKDVCPQGVKTKTIYDKRKGKYYPSHTVCTYVNAYFSELYKLFYPQGRKKITRKALNMLTEKAVAYWVMDDGGLGKSKRSNGYIGYSFYLNTYVSDEEHDLIIEYFKKNYGVEFKKNKNKNSYRLRLGKKQSLKFFKKIEKYILPEFKHKINIPK